MFSFFRKDRITKRLNTVNLYGDGDDVDIVQDVEKAFGIAISDEEAEAVCTVGELYDLIHVKLKDKDDFDAVWELTRQLVRIVSDTKDPIDRNTTFFAEDAKER